MPENAVHFSGCPFCLLFGKKKVRIIITSWNIQTETLSIIACMILCITHTEDYYNIDLVARALEARGEKLVRFNSDQFSYQHPFHYRMDNAGSSCYISQDGKTIHPDDITAVWNRKLWAINYPGELDEAYRSIYLQEYDTMRHIFFDMLEDRPWFNPMHVERAVSNNKMRQQELARKNGLTVPATILTNDAQEVRNFFDRCCNGQMIVKMHGVLSVSMSGNTPMFPTSRFTEANLPDLDSLQYCPMIFQEYIPKMYELRIAYVDGAFFAGKLATDDTITDWRSYNYGQLQWAPYELPADIAAKLDQTMKDLGVLLGAIDVIRNPEGDYVFLEVNPSGEWGMLQKFLNYPIAETLAQKLIEKTRN